jgi:hypothetical protein
MKTFYSFFWILDNAFPVSDDRRYAVKGIVEYPADSQSSAREGVMGMAPQIEARLPKEYRHKSFSVEPTRFAFGSVFDLMGTISITGEETLVEVKVD